MTIGRKPGNPGLTRLVLLAAAALGGAILLPHSAAAASEQVLYSFCPQSPCTDGVQPYAGLVMDSAGNLYGTTGAGGTPGNGVVFALAPDGTQTVLYSFGGADGAFPHAGLITDAAGNLFGTTDSGGTSGRGVVFELMPDPTGTVWTETVLYSFQGGAADGAQPQAGLVMDAAGNLYGTTRGGGSGGVVFALQPDGTETVLYSFCQQVGCADGSSPLAGLIMDAAGNLYGTTSNGGSNGSGVVFQLAYNGIYTVLYSFCAQVGCVDGANPLAGLIMDAAGNLYGTTFSGGTLNGGAVFALAPDGTETVLYSFQGGTADGAGPFAGLIMDAAGNLYGTTRDGGASSKGVAFELASDGTETVLYSFGGPPDGANPLAGLIMDMAGNLYGTTIGGGAGNNGVVFKLTP